MSSRVTSFLMMVALSCSTIFVPFLFAQDTRTVNEPTFPPVCAVLTAQMSIVPGPAGSSGGAPSSQTMFDTTRIANALSTCASGYAVELSASGTNYAFLTQPLTLPAGVTLLIDPGVTLFGSLNPQDYQITGQNTCGTLQSTGGGCEAVINVSSASGTGIMGYGVINGQSNTPLINSSGSQLANSNAYADCPSTYITWYCMTYTGRNVNPHKVPNNPKLVSAFEAGNFTLYKTTFLNSPYFNVYWYGGEPSAQPYSTPPTSGFTAWGVKILTPQQYENTDGIDPEHNVENITITDSYISNGDDNIALDSDDPGFPLKNVTISNLHGYAGLGLSIGSETGGGISNVLYNNIYQSGNTAQALGMGLHIKSNDTEGGLVNNVTYNNVCQQNENYPIDILPFQGGESGGSTIPHYTNISITNYTDLGGGVNGFVLQGHDSSNVTTLTMSNVTVDGTIYFNKAPSDDSHSVTPENLALTIGPYQVPSAFANLQTTYGSNDVTVAGTTTTTTPYPCTAASFPSLIGELFEQTSTATNLQSATATYPGTIKLNAVIEPATLELPALSGTSVSFYDGTTYVGSGNLVGNGTYASLTLTGVSAGTHSYTATYSGDTNYPGTFTITSTSGTGPALFTVAVAGTMTKLGTVPTPQSVGTAVPLTATVSSSGGTPSGVVTFLVNGTAIPGTYTLDGSGVATASYTFSSTGGPYTVSASYAAQGNYGASASTGQAVTISTAPGAATTTAVSFNSPAVPGVAVLLSASVSSSGGTPTGSVTFYSNGQMTGTVQQLVNGAASISYSPAATSYPAYFSITASYTPTGSFNTSNAAAQLLVITPQNIWVVNSNGTMSEFNDNGAPLSSSAFPGGGTNIGIDGSGNVWSANATANALTELTQTGSTAGTSNGGGLSGATGLAIDGAGQVWVTNTNNSLSVFSNNGFAVTSTAGYTGIGLNGPSALAIDAAGDVWVANASGSTVTEFFGAADPVVTPASVAVANGTTGVKP